MVEQGAQAVASWGWKAVVSGVEFGGGSRERKAAIKIVVKDLNILSRQRLAVVMYIRAACCAVLGIIIITCKAWIIFTV